MPGAAAVAVLPRRGVVSGWLLQILVNVDRDRRRRRTHLSIADDDEAEAKSASVAEAATAAELQVRVRNEIDRLPERQRGSGACLVGAKGWPQERSPRRLEITEANVYATLHAALASGSPKR